MLSAPLTIGIEEEYQIVDPETRRLTSYVQKFLERGRVLGTDIKPEFMQSQVEVGSRICRNIEEARQEIRRLRRTVSQIAKDAGLRIAAAGTHPFARWADQEITEGERYADLEADMQDVARRLLIFGMHVHIGFGEGQKQRELLIDIMNQVRYFVPHILALSTSSPFWHGRDTGLKSYRSVVFESLPRTGIPPRFNSWAEYDRFVEMLLRVGSLGKGDPLQEGAKMDGATRIWWDLRPSPRFGTLEFRIADMCTRLDEAVCVAALFQAIAAKLIKLRQANMSWRYYRKNLIIENKWRAARYGISGKLIDFGKEEEVPLRFLIGELLELVDDVVDELGSRQAVEYARTILDEGTSADRQLACYRARLEAGEDEQTALNAVVDQLVAETHERLQA